MVAFGSEAKISTEAMTEEIHKKQVSRGQKHDLSSSSTVILERLEVTLYHCQGALLEPRQL